MSPTPGRPRVVALLAEIKERPWDDLPRLILADWLEDHGEADRAEFIRLQCRLAALDETDPPPGLRRRLATDVAAYELSPQDREAPPRRELRRREQELLALHEADWLGPLLGTHLADWEFRRGLLRLRPKKLELNGREMTALIGTEALAWVEGVALRGLDAHTFRRCLASPVLREAVALEVRRCHVGPDEMAALAACPHLAGLDSLRLEGWHVLGAGLGRLAATPHLRRLTRLALRRSAAVSPDDLAPLAALPRLTDLDLSRNGWVGGVGGLPDCPLLARLTRLDLGNNSLMHEDPGQYGGRNGIAALAASPHVAGLTHLNLADNFLQEGEAEHLLASPHLGRLVAFDLSYNGFRADVEERLRRRFGPGLRL
jgi:uncharacterized protein (TIGR02996 family)